MYLNAWASTSLTNISLPTQQCQSFEFKKSLRTILSPLSYLSKEDLLHMPQLGHIAKSPKYFARNSKHLLHTVAEPLVKNFSCQTVGEMSKPARTHQSLLPSTALSADVTSALVESVNCQSGSAFITSAAT